LALQNSKRVNRAAAGIARLQKIAMPEQQRPPFAVRAAGWISTPFLYALMVGIVIRAARRWPAGQTGGVR